MIFFRNRRVKNHIVPDSNGDYNVKAFVKILKRLEPHLPISDQYDKENGQDTGVFWSSQKEHMVSWFSSQKTTGAGQYTRNKPNLSAKLTYNRLQCPGALLWIAEALGEDEYLLNEAANAALAVSDKRRRSGIIRSFIPWSHIMKLAENCSRGQ